MKGLAGYRRNRRYCFCFLGRVSRSRTIPIAITAPKIPSAVWSNVPSGWNIKSSPPFRNLLGPALHATSTISPYRATAHDLRAACLVYQSSELGDRSNLRYVRDCSSSRASNLEFVSRSNSSKSFWQACMVSNRCSRSLIFSEVGIDDQRAIEITSLTCDSDRKGLAPFRCKKVRTL